MMQLQESLVQGLKGQPVPSKSFLVSLQKIQDGFAQGDASSARPKLLLLIEDSPTVDFTESIALLLENTLVYQGVVATLEDAMTSIRAEDRNFLLYNLARVHYLRATILIPNLRPPVLAAGAKVLAQIPRSVQDGALWEMAGDMETMRRAPDSARGYYLRLSESGRSSAYAQYKTAMAYILSGKGADGIEGLRKALLSSGATGLLRHVIYQEIARQETVDRRYKQAVDILMLSANVPQEKEKPFRLRLDVAQMLLQLGQGRLILPYLAKARAIAPDDTRIAELEAQARRAR